MKTRRIPIRSATEIAPLLDLEPRAFETAVSELLEACDGKQVVLVPFRLDRHEDEASTAYDRRREQAFARVFDFLQRRAVRALTACKHPIPRASGDDQDPLASQMIRITRGALRAGAKGDFAFRCLRELSDWRDAYLSEQTYLLPVLVEKYFHMGVDRDDLLQEGALGLLRAIDGYDWRRGVRFSTYAKYWIQDRVLKALYDQSRTVRLPAWIQKLWQKVHRISSSDQAAGAPVVTPELAKELDVSERRLQRVIDSRRSQVSLDVSMPGDEGSSFADELADPRSLDFSMPSDESSLTDSLHAVLSGFSDRERRIVQERFGMDGQAPRSLKEIGDDLGLSAERVRQIQASVLERLRENGRIQALEGVMG